MIELVNSFFDAVTRNVSKRGGEVTKFIGDCVMAYFDGSQADAALECALSIIQEVDDMRHKASKTDPTKILHCGIGINRGKHSYCETYSALALISPARPGD